MGFYFTSDIFYGLNKIYGNCMTQGIGADSLKLGFLVAAPTTGLTF